MRRPWHPVRMDGPLPLSALLSQVLVAFTIEFDNEAEHRMPHTTTRHGAASGLLRGPWLVSLAMYANCMQHMGDEPISLLELERRARTHTNLHGMQRWGYITVAPDPADKRAKPPQSAWLVRPTPVGRDAQQIWYGLFRVIEKRWRTRFGDELVDRLREALFPVVAQLDPRLPDCLPILGYGLLCAGPNPKLPAPPPAPDPADLPLSALLSKTLLAFALEFEAKSRLSLAISANVMRVLDPTGVEVRQLPFLSGVSKESISMAMGILRKFRLSVVEPNPAGTPWKLLRPTPLGVTVQANYHQADAGVEKEWQARFGPEALRKLREPLEELVQDGTPNHSPLFAGLEPYPEGWRAAVRKPQILPHFPMVLHRGAYPDGS
jgi:hypothetical protein